VAAREGDVSAEARAEARKLAAEGSDAFEAGQFQHALELFDRAASIVEAPTIALMQARTLAELGRLAAAAERYTAAQRSVPADEGNAAFRSAAETAAKELSNLKPRVPMLRIKLVGVEPGAAAVTIDGNLVPPEAVSADQLLDPGPHSVEVRTATGTAAARAVTLKEGAREELVFSFEAAAPAVTASSLASSDAPASHEQPAPRPRTWGWVTLGTGVAFTGAATVIGISALGHKSDLDAHCASGCPPEYEDKLHTYRVQRTLSYVGFALGATGVGAGLYLLLRSEPGTTTATLALTPDGVSLSGRFQ